MHNDIGALLQHLGAVGGSARVLAQVLLADIVEGEDAGELCVRLQGPALRLYHCLLCLVGDCREQGVKDIKGLGLCRWDPHKCLSYCPLFASPQEGISTTDSRWEGSEPCVTD